MEIAFPQMGAGVNESNYLDYYDLESYLFDVVHPRFAAAGTLSAFDFFCIVVWKANRAKSKVAKNLRANRPGSLDEIVAELTSGVAKQATARDQLRYLFETWGLRLPMASAILTVLYPDEFTVYDVRVCDQLGAFHKLVNYMRFDSLWTAYEAFRARVIEVAPAGLSLRDKDRYLWGKSFAEQLHGQIARGFVADSSDETLSQTVTQTEREPTTG
jgi:hypothetical protein